MSLVYITCKNKKEAIKISNHLLKKKLIACANYFPIQSSYWWNNKIVNDDEFAIITKTNDFNKVIKETEKIHSYDVPCILKIEEQSSPKFKKWADSVLKKDV